MLSFPADYLSCFPPQKSCQLWNNVRGLCVVSDPPVTTADYSLKYSRQPLKSAQLLHWVLGPSTFSHSQDLCTGKRSKDRHDRWILRTLCDFPGWLSELLFVLACGVPKGAETQAKLETTRLWQVMAHLWGVLAETFEKTLYVQWKQNTRHLKQILSRAKETSIMNQMFFLN